MPRASASSVMPMKPSNCSCWRHTLSIARPMRASTSTTAERRRLALAGMR